VTITTVKSGAGTAVNALSIAIAAWNTRATLAEIEGEKG
jgi:hypothetical protein